MGLIKELHKFWILPYQVGDRLGKIELDLNLYHF